MKRNRKLVSILLTLSLLVTLLVPMVGPASAATNYTMSNVQTVKAGDDVTVGTMEVDLDSSSFPAAGAVDQYVYLSLPASPTGYSFKDLDISVPVRVDGENNAIQAGDVLIDSAAQPDGTYDGRLLKIKIDNVSNAGVKGRFFIGSDNGGNFAGLKLDIPSGVSGDVTATLNAPSSRIFSNGSVVIARVGTGTVTVSAENVPSLGSSGGQVGLIDVKEAVAGSIVNATSSVVFTLPPGFSWRHDAAIDTLYWGSQAGLTFNYGNNDRDLKLTSVGRNVAGSFFNIDANIDVDESVAKAGDVVVSVSGDSSATPSSLTVAKYGEFNVTTDVVEATNITAGKSDAKLGKFAVREALAGSLTEDRTITLTLPEGAKWTNFPVIDTDLSKNDTQVQFVSTNGYRWAPVGTDGRMIKAVVNQNDGNAGSNDPAEIVFKDGKLVTGPDFTPGDLKVTVGGSMGVSGDLVLAKVNSVVTATVASSPDVKIGLPDQAAGDMTITESAAGAIDSNKNWTERDTAYNADQDKKLTSDSDSTQTKMQIVAPPGVRFTSTPTVAVTDGDLQLDPNGVKLDGDDQVLYIPIKSSSTKASTIKISDIKVTVDRTVPEGDLTLKVQGNAVNESLTQGGADDYFPGAVTAAKSAVAKCVTPAPGVTKATAVFKIGDTNFTLNGVDQTMDAAPYLKNDRTYLPLRFVAKAVGVPDSNIIWNADEQSVVLIKDSSVVKLVIGSNTMYINGTPITMDVAPEVVDPGRTMLPVRWVAQALGANIQWDNATQTVTVN